MIGSTLIRCRQHIEHVVSGLHAARQAAESDAGEEIVAAELRIALEHLGQIVGKVYTCLLYTSPSPRDKRQTRMPSSA